MNKCKKCGGFYDAGEKCKCEEMHRPVKRPIAKSELKKKLTDMSYEEFTRYQNSFNKISRGCAV